MKIPTRIRPSTRCWTQLCSMLPTVSVATASGRMKNRPMPRIAVMPSIRIDAALAELDALVLGLEPGGPDEPAGADDERLVEHDEAAHERPARHAVAVEAGVEPLGGEDDAAVGVAERDGDGVAAAHHDALDERLAAVVEAGHGPSLAGGSRSALRSFRGVHHRDVHGAGLRVVIAEDSVLLREGLVRLLEDAGASVVARVGDGPSLVAAVVEHRPDVSIVDVRMPPTQRDEGLRAAIEARRRVHGSPVLVLSQYVEREYASELLADGAGGVGYLLKDRVADVREFMDALARVAGGGTALDPEVVAQLMVSRRRDDRLAALTPREREVLAAMAEGKTNVGIATELVISEGAAEKHITSILGKLDLPDSENDHRRVLAVLAFLDAGG